VIHIFGAAHRDSGLAMERGPAKHQGIHPSYQFLYVVHGTAEVRTDEHSLQLHKDECVIIEPNQSVLLSLASADSLVARYYFSDDLLAETFQQLELHSGIEKDDLSQHSPLKRVVNQMLHYFMQNEGAVDYHVISLSYETLHHVTMIYGNDSSQATKQTVRESSIKAYIKKNYRHELTLSTIAAEFEMSPSYFSRYFKQQFGTGLVEYVTAYRLKQAAEKLKRTDEKVSLIASETGFSNLSNFNKKFRQQFGLTPKAYRDENNEFLAMKQLPVNQSQTLDALQYFSEAIAPVDYIKEVSLHSAEKMGRNGSPWATLINIGSAENLLQYDIRQHLTLLKKDLNYEYVRFWNLFTKGMNIDPDLTEDYNFDKIDSVLDFFMDIEILPFIELGYKIRRVQRSTKEAVVYDNDDFKFSLNSKEWQELIEKFMVHVTYRYGTENVSRWKFELSLNYSSESEFLEQVKHYDRTYKIIKKYAPKVQIGGPGSKPQNTGKYNFREDLKKLAQKGIRFDFISYMLYPYLEDEKGERFAKMIDDPSFLAHKLDEIEEAVAYAGYADLPIYITEWSNTVSNRSVINDTVNKGAYIIKNMIGVAHRTSGIGYWVGSDLFGEFADSKAILHGGTGLVTKRDLAKPAMHAMRFLNFLQSNILSIGPDYIVTKGPGDDFSIICHNYKPLHASFYQLMKENEVKIDELSEYYIDSEKKAFRFSLEGAGSKRFELKILRVNDVYGNLISGWKDLGYRTSLRKQDIDYLSRVSDPQVTYEQLHTHNGKIKTELVLEANEFVYISLIEMK